MPVSFSVGGDSQMFWDGASKLGRIVETVSGNGESNWLGWIVIGGGLLLILCVVLFIWVDKNNGKTS